MYINIQNMENNLLSAFKYTLFPDIVKNSILWINTRFYRKDMK